MVNALLLFFGILLISSVIVLVDWMGRRKDRRAREHPTR